MDSQNLVTNAQNMPAGARSDMSEETGKNGPSLAEIHERALEIHVKRGGHFCDLDNYLDEWMQAERKLKEKYKTSNDEGAKNKSDGCQNDHGCDPVPARSEEAGNLDRSEGQRLRGEDPMFSALSFIPA